MTVSWKTSCHLVKGWDTTNCCPSCHDDADEYGIEPCNIEIDDKVYYVCCKCKQGYYSINQEKGE